jgi:hypothetical protein
MHACLFVPLPLLIKEEVREDVWCVQEWYWCGGCFVAASRCCVCFSIAWSAKCFGNALISVPWRQGWLLLWKPVFYLYLLHTCAGVMLWCVLLPYIRKRLGVLVTPAPPGAGQLLTFCVAVAACACFQVTSCMLRSVCACNLLVLLDRERFSYGRGRSRPLSFQVLLCIHAFTSCLPCTVSSSACTWLLVTVCIDYTALTHVTAVLIAAYMWTCLHAVLIQIAALLLCCRCQQVVLRFRLICNYAFHMQDSVATLVSGGWMHWWRQ